MVTSLSRFTVQTIVMCPNGHSCNLDFRVALLDGMTSLSFMSISFNSMNKKRINVNTASAMLFDGTVEIHPYHNGKAGVCSFKLCWLALFLLIAW